MGNRPARIRNPDPDFLPRLPLDKKIPPYALKRRGAISGVPDLQNNQPIQRPRYKRRGGVCYDKTDNIAVYIRYLGDAISKQRKASKFTEFHHLPEVPVNILTSDLKLPEYAHRRCSLEGKVSPAQLYKQLLDKTAVFTVGADSSNAMGCSITRMVCLWNFDLLSFRRLTEGRPMYYLGMCLFEKHNLMVILELDSNKVMRFLALAEQWYRGGNPYHNGIHACDVTQALNCLISTKKILDKLTPVELLAALMAAMVHDVDHPGVNQTYLVNSQDQLATVHGASSTLERHHCCTARSIIAESGIIDHMSPDKQKQVIDIMEQMVLSTDMSKHKEYVADFQRRADADGLNLDVPENRLCVLKIALKCADISNPARPWSICKEWCSAVMDEFFHQGDLERKLSLPISFLCDRNTVDIPKSQDAFIGFVVEPLFALWSKYFSSNTTKTIHENLASNKLCWADLSPKKATVTESSDDSN